MASEKRVGRYLVIAAFLQLLWGVVPSASRFIIQEIPVELYIALRWTISSLLIFIYLFLRRRWQKLSFPDVLRVSGLGVLGYGLASLGFLYGLKIGGVINFALVVALSPVLTSLIACVVLRERPQKLFYLALPICLLGLVVLSFGKYQISSLSVVGQSTTLLILALILEAFVFVFSKKFAARVPALQYLAIAQGATALFAWFLQWGVYRQFAELRQLSGLGIAATIFVSVVACVLCYGILYWLLNYIEGHRLALFDAFHALSATLMGYFWFREPLRPLMIAGAGLMLVGLVLGNWPRSAPKID